MNTDRTVEDVNPLSSGNDPHSVETAADDFSAMLADEGRPRPRREREKPAAQSPAPKGEDDGGEGEAERQPPEERPEPKAPRKDRDPILDDAEDGDAEEEDPEDTEADEDEDTDDTEDQDEDDDGPDPLEAKHKVTVDGKELEISVKEALAGYQRDADYRQKTERNAREYEEIQQFAVATVERRQTADNALQQAMALIEALQPSKEDWDALEKSNPQGFIDAQKHWRGLIQKANEIHAARVKLAGDAEAETESGRTKYLQTQERELLAKFPALRDEKKANSFRQAIMEYGRKAGYSDEELVNGAVDHRDLITLYKAAMYDRTRASISAAGKQAKGKAPKPSDESRPRIPSRSNRDARRNAERKLQRSGSVHDAADAFAEMIRNGG